MSNALYDEIDRLKVVNGELLEACKASLQWFAKLAMDHHRDYIACNVMLHYKKVEAAIKAAEVMP